MFDFLDLQHLTLTDSTDQLATAYPILSFASKGLVSTFPCRQEQLSPIAIRLLLATLQLTPLNWQVLYFELRFLACTPYTNQCYPSEF